MNNSKFQKTIAFLILLIIFISVSFGLRTLLVNKFNGYDLKIISIDHINNYGAAFSLLQNHTIILIMISAIILFCAMFYIFRNIQNFKNSDVLLTSMLSAGIICNLIERLIDGHVTDYIKLNFVAFPIFNISDIFICVGAFILICNILFNDERNS